MTARPDPNDTCPAGFLCNSMQQTVSLLPARDCPNLSTCRGLIGSSALAADGRVDPGAGTIVFFEGSGSEFLVLCPDLFGEFPNNLAVVTDRRD